MSIRQVECVDPTSTLTEGGIYVLKRTIKESGKFATHAVSWDEATHVLVKNDRGEIIRTQSKRFKLPDE